MTVRNSSDPVILMALRQATGMLRLSQGIRRGADQRPQYSAGWADKGAYFGRGLWWLNRGRPTTVGSSALGAAYEMATGRLGPVVRWSPWVSLRNQSPDDLLWRPEAEATLERFYAMNLNWPVRACEKPLFPFPFVPKKFTMELEWRPIAVGREHCLESYIVYLNDVARISRHQIALMVTNAALELARNARKVQDLGWDEVRGRMHLEFDKMHQGIDVS